MIQTSYPLYAILAGFILVIAFGTVSAQDPIDSILSTGHQEILCSPAADGVDVVKPDMLASILVYNARVPFDLLDTANSTGVADHSVAFDELIYALVTTAHPFGLGHSESERAKLTKKKLDSELGVLGDFLQRGTTSDGRFVVQTNPTDATGPDVLLLFSDPANTRIRCVGSSQAKPERMKPTTSDEATTSDEGLVIRGRVSELALRRGVLKVYGASAAEISLRNDRENDVETFGVSGVLGFRYGTFQFIPYVKYEKYEKKDTTGADEADIEVLSPGILWSTHGRLGTNITADWSLNPTANLDLEQDSERLTLRGVFGPAVSIGDWDWFGGYLPTSGPVLLRPDLKFQVEASYVLNPGRSMEIPDDYLGLGGEAELKIRIRDVKVLQDFVGSVSYRHLEMLGDEEIKDVSRFETALLYAVPGNNNLAVQFAYENGDNAETFQEEDLFKITLGFRY